MNSLVTSITADGIEIFQKEKNILHIRINEKVTVNDFKFIQRAIDENKDADSLRALVEYKNIEGITFDALLEKFKMS